MAATARPDPPAGARSLVLVVLDSLRYDSWCAADPVNLARLGPVQRRFSYASWTAPSHYALLMGLMPHTSPAGVYASEYYRRDFLRYSERLGVEQIGFRQLLPSLYLPTFLRNSLGYRTHAMVSLPVLNPSTTLNRDFDSYELMPSHNDMAAMVRRMRFEADRPSFYLLNVGETHYPYALPHDPPNEWPRLPGVHGVFAHLDDMATGEPPPAATDPPADTSSDAAPTDGFFDREALEELRERQVAALRYLDGEVFPRLFAVMPEGAWLIVTADHGELFGEDGYFGHGPIAHEKVLEVPFVEGLVRR
jgi:hypothetical protein